MRTVKKNILEIKEEVQIGNVILEAGDKIEILSEKLNENMGPLEILVNALHTSYEEHFDIPGLYLVDNDKNLQISYYPSGTRFDMGFEIADDEGVMIYQGTDVYKAIEVVKNY